MKIIYKLLFSLLLVFSFTILVACDSTSDTNLNDDSISTDKQLLISDYKLPENFFMTLELSDTSIFDKGDPWYYKTAKIGNDWQLIEYDRDLADTTQQVRHFFKYISDDIYTHYTYNYSDQNWVEAETVSFQKMVLTSANNFKFLYTKPTEIQYHIVESTSSYDCDPTSIENLRDATMYEYSYGLDMEFIVDSQYSNIVLSEVQRDGSLVCIEWRAYEFNLTISSWNSTYLASKNFIDSPL